MLSRDTKYLNRIKELEEEVKTLKSELNSLRLSEIERQEIDSEIRVEFGLPQDQRPLEFHLRDRLNAIAALVGRDKPRDPESAPDSNVLDFIKARRSSELRSMHALTRAKAMHPAASNPTESLSDDKNRK